MTKDYEKCYNSFKDNLKNHIQTNKNELYHYTSSSGLKNILNSKKIWFSNVEYLNDEEEIYYTYKLAIDVANDLKATLNKNFYSDTISILEKYLKQKESQEQPRDYYVASFSEEKDSLSLWNYYTKSPNSVGYNICFTIKDIINSQIENLKSTFDTSKIFLGKIIYDPEQQKNIIKESLIAFNNLYIKEKDYKNCIMINMHYWFSIRDCSLFFKHPAFEQEKEFRVILPISNCVKDNSSIKIRESGLFFIPYIEIGFESQNVISVTCSPTAKNQLIQAGVKKMLSAYKYNSIPVEISNIPLRY